MIDQINALRLMQDGWLDGDGLAPYHELLDMLEDIPESWTAPRIYPTPEGGVLLEWMFGPHNVSLELEQSWQGHWHDLNLMSDETIDRQLNFKDHFSSSWLWAAGQLRLLKDAHGDPR